MKVIISITVDLYNYEIPYIFENFNVLMTISIFPDTQPYDRYPLSGTNSIVIIAGPWSQNLETLIVFEHNHRVIVNPVIDILSRIR